MDIPAFWIPGDKDIVQEELDTLSSHLTSSTGSASSSKKAIEQN